MRFIIIVTLLLSSFCLHAQDFDFNKLKPVDSCVYYKRKLDTTMHQLDDGSNVEDWTVVKKKNFRNE